MKFFYCLLLVLSSVFVGCKTNPPDITETPITLYGKVAVTSTVAGASIYLDNENTGKVTPDTVLAAVGSRQIKIEKDGYLPYSEIVNVQENLVSVVNAVLQVQIASKVVLLEDFANVSCDPCVVSNRIIESLAKTHYGKLKVVAVKYATSWPSPNDPFYLANKSDAQARWGQNFYYITNAPTVIVDGIMRPVPTDSNAIKSTIDSRLNQPVKFDLEVKDSLAGSNYFIKVNVTVYDTIGLNTENLILHTVITETDIEFAAPPGSNGETKFYNVMRKMLPTNSGEALGSIAPGTILNFQREFQLNSTWVKNNTHTVVFIQDKITKEIYQAGTTE